MITAPYVLIISGGPMPECASLIKKYASSADAVICADSGVDYALAAGVSFDKVYGDFDSISKEGMEYIKTNDIPMEVFPCEKDMTDTELVLSSISEDMNIVLFCSLQGRPDHVISNVLICSRYASLGRKIIICDGNTKVYFLHGEDSLSYTSNTVNKEVVSLLPMDINIPVCGVTTRGLYYELNDAELKYGSSLGVSNCFKDNGNEFLVTIKSGLLAVYITREV